MLHDCLGKYVVAYIDDILIYYLNEESHVQNVCEVLKRLKANQLYVKRMKFH